MHRSRQTCLVAYASGQAVPSVGRQVACMAFGADPSAHVLAAAATEPEEGHAVAAVQLAVVARQRCEPHIAEQPPAVAVVQLAVVARQRCERHAAGQPSVEAAGQPSVEAAGRPSVEAAAIGHLEREERR